MRKLRIKCNGKQGTCNNFISGTFSSFNELAAENNWQAVGKGWTCEDCQGSQNKKREIIKPEKKSFKFKETKDLDLNEE